jgi:hypothetical protein
MEKIKLFTSVNRSFQVNINIKETIMKTKNYYV